MAGRKVQTLVIATEGRDQNKAFVLTEMGSYAAWLWATKALQAIVRAGVDTPKGAEGMHGLAATVAGEKSPLGGVAVLSALQDPSLEAWIDCVQFDPGEGLPLQKIHMGKHASLCQIEEMSTWRELQDAVMQLHMGFFSVERPSPPITPPAQSPPPASSTIPMSRRRSRPSSPPATPPFTS